MQHQRALDFFDFSKGSSSINSTTQTQMWNHKEENRRQSFIRRFKKEKKEKTHHMVLNQLTSVICSEKLHSCQVRGRQTIVLGLMIKLDAAQEI